MTEYTAELVSEPCRIFAMVEATDGPALVNLDQIVMARHWDTEKCQIHLSNGTRLVVKQTLDSLAADLRKMT